MRGARAGRPALLGALLLAACGCGRASPEAAVARAPAALSATSQVPLDTGSDGTDAYGTAVAVAGDTLLVGAFMTTVSNQADAGAVVVFKRNGAAWDYQDTLSAPTPVNSALFGSAIAITTDGIFIGAPDETVASQTAAGAVYFFTWNGTYWVSSQRITADDPQPKALFGSALAARAGWLLVGAPGNLVTPGATPGAAYAFASNASWIQSRKVLPSDPAAGDGFGSAVAIAPDCARLLVGAPWRDGQQGAAYGFTWDGSTAVEITRLPGHGALERYGTAVALGAGVGLVGAPTAGGAAGGVYPIVGTSTFSELARIGASDGFAGDHFGVAVALAGDLALVGAPGGASNGAVYGLLRSGAGFAQAGRFAAPDATGAPEYGLVLDFDGATAAVGAPPLAYATAIRRTQGEACASHGQCQSGACADGVCCDELCADPCRTCAGGTCHAVTSGPDPGACDGTRACNAAGVCVTITDAGTPDAPPPPDGGGADATTPPDAGEDGPPPSADAGEDGAAPPGDAAAGTDAAPTGDAGREAAPGDGGAAAAADDFYRCDCMIGSATGRTSGRLAPLLAMLLLGRRRARRGSTR
ncbi:MAG TPA: hypothetical protein VGQ83_01115 [Polyangia bacterium]